MLSQARGTIRGGPEKNAKGKLVYSSKRKRCQEPILDADILIACSVLSRGVAYSRKIIKVSGTIFFVWKRRRSRSRDQTIPCEMDRLQPTEQSITS